MAVYSYYYGAVPSQGIGVQAQSRELQNLPCQPTLNELASMHALSSAEQSSDRLCFLLAADQHTVLGMSYTEPPQSSRYNRSAPCSVQYIAPIRQVYDEADALGRIVNFVNFQKPTSAAPAPLNTFPLNESGSSYHYSAAVLAPMVDGLVRVTLNPGRELLLIGLPGGKSNDYASARYAIAEALNYLPISLRPHVHFFTGLPVSEGVTDPLAGLDNAIRFGANVVFCPNEHFAQLQTYRKCIAVSMDAPARTGSVFSNLIANAVDVSYTLQQVENSLPRSGISYDALNAAATQVQQGKLVTLEAMRDERDQLYKDNVAMQEQLRKLNDALNKANERIQLLENKMKADRQQAKADRRQSRRSRRDESAAYMPAYENSSSLGYDSTDTEDSSGTSVLTRIAIIVCTLLIIGVIGFGVWYFAFREDAKQPQSDLPGAVPTVSAVTSATDAPTDIPADIDTFLPTGESAEQADTPADEPTDAPTDIPADIPDDANG